MSAPVEVPEDIVERIRRICLALPEVTVRVDGSLIRARSTAQSFDVRRRSFCLLVAWEDSAGKPVPLLVLRADPDEREALLSIGHPFFASRAGRDRIVVVLTDNTDWKEIRELMTESYRILAPKKLTAHCSTSTRRPSSPQRLRACRRRSARAVDVDDVAAGQQPVKITALGGQIDEASSSTGRLCRPARADVSVIAPSPSRTR